MKIIKYANLLILSFVTVCALHGQTLYKWYETNTNTNYTINSIIMPFAAGDHGTFIKWDYNRNKWNSIDLGITSNVTRLYNSYPDNYYMTGDNGLVMKTTNYGYNWINISLGQNEYITDCAGFTLNPANTKYLFVVCKSGNIFYTTNSGVNWTKIQTGLSVSLNSVAFNKTMSTAPTKGIIAGNIGTILTTTNSGMNWSLINLGMTQNLNCVSFADSSTAYVVGNGGKFLRTYNGGADWINENLYTDNNLNSIKILSTSSSQYGIIAGDNGACFTFNGTYSPWIYETTNTNYNFKSCNQDGNNTFFYLTGENGKVLFKTYDSLYYSIYELSGNNIRTRVSDDGTFNKNPNMSGFEWPKDSMSFAIYTSGINICAKVNDVTKMSSASFFGEYTPGYCDNGVFITDSRFKIYKVRKNDNPNQYDYANWWKMVPYGAPYYDVNHNGVYDQGIDIPGVKGADETVFVCITDADPVHHNPSVGFGGGTPPLYSEIHFTMWCYNYGKMKDVDFIKAEIINKSPLGNQYIWDSTQTAFFFDPYIPSRHGQFMGSDSIRNMGYTYCAQDSSDEYGFNPPAVGMSILKGININNIIKKSTSAIRIHHNNNDPVVCEREPESDLAAAYNVMRGLKNDGTKWVVPNTNPPQITKFTFSGDPETNSGWNPSAGRVNNCGNVITGSVVQELPLGSSRCILASGDDNLKMYPGDRQTIIAAQFIARGFSNLNSVTRLKELCDSVQAFYETGFPVPYDTTDALPLSYMLYQNYPNPFNPVTKIRFDIPQSDHISISIFDVTGREITKLVNGNFTAGKYEYIWDGKNYSSGIYFCRFMSHFNGFTIVKKMALIK
jgi:photosystem II stability/assembly factor-like uncharacterized protein